MTKTPAWYLPAIMSLVLWGLWGFLEKLATNHIPPRQVYVLSALGTLVVFLALLAVDRFSLDLDAEGALFAVGAGICSATGTLLFFFVLSKGEASVVVPFTALYPVVTIAAGFLLLNETITVKQGVGIVLALFSMVLLA